MKKIRLGLMSYAADNRPAKGTALYTREIIEGLKKDPRFDITLIHYDEVKDPLYHGVKSLLMPKFPFPGGHMLGQLFFFWRQRKESFDVVHWFQPRLYPFFWLAPARLKTVTLHGAGMVASDTGFYISNKVFNQVIKFFWRKIDRTIADTHNAKEEIIKHYGISGEKISVIYCGTGKLFSPMDKSEAKEVVAREYKVVQPFILNVSRLQPHKNLVSLIEGYNRYRNNGGTEHLVIVGTNTDESGPIFEKAKQSPYVADIHFFENIPTEHLRAFYSSASLLACLSLDEGFGLPVVEAMACGTAVVVSDRTSLPEVAGDAGIIVPAYGYDEIAAAFSRIINDKNFRDNLIEKGKERVKQFTWERAVAETSQLFSSYAFPVECAVCKKLDAYASVEIGSKHIDSGQTYQLYKCSACGVTFWSPFKNPGSEWYERDERYAGANHLPPLDPNWNHRKVISFLQNKLDRGDRRVLDVGCGTGNFLAWAVKKGWKGWGIDFDSNAIRACKEVFNLENCELGDVVTYADKNGGKKFNLITFFDVVEHIDNHQEFFAAVRKLIEPGGYLAMSMPYGRGSRFFQPNDLPPRHLTRWNEDSLEFFLKTQGFTVEYCRRSPASIYFIALKLKHRFKVPVSLGVMKKMQQKETQGGQKKIGKKYSYKYRMLAAAAKVKDLVLFGIPAVFVWLVYLPTRTRYIGLYAIAKKD